MKSVRIVGSGLIGTSIGLGLSGRGVQVTMVDSDAKRELLAQDLMGGGSTLPSEVVILALPTSYLEVVISAELQLNPQATFMDIGSVKTKPLQYLQNFPESSPRFCGTHPMAGREVGGPESARADLFEGRPWIYCPTPNSLEQTVVDVVAIIEMLGATPIEMSAEGHDAAVALISHLPQLVSSVLAGELTRAPEEWLKLSGQGLRDSTRIAASAPGLWREIIALNRGQILPLLRKFAGNINKLVEHFDDDDVIAATLEEGRAGRERIPGKHGGRNRDYVYLPIVIEDKPGQLALLFQECAEAKVNIEDLSIEHSPGQFTGLITLALSQIESVTLSQHLQARGWKVHGL